MRRQVTAAAVLWLGLAGLTDRAAAQPPAPTARMTFKEAVGQATERNPSVQQAAQEILRAEAILRQATSSILPALNAGVVNTTLNTGRSFNGESVVPQNQVTANLNLSALLFAPVQWAERAQARDNQRVTEFGAADVRRQIAVATAQAYLAIIARRRVLEAQVRARDVAQAHYELARQLRAGGAGSRLNELRAQQSLSSDEVLAEEAALAVYNAQEALGVLVAADGPVDAAEEPVLEVPSTLEAAEAALPQTRSDLRLADARTRAAGRVLSDSWKDYLPSVAGLFQPQYLQPETIFQPSLSWRAQVLVNVPILDFGFRRAARTERQALLDESRFEQAALLRQANSDVRSAVEAIKSAGRAMASARAAADEARQVVDIVNVSFRAGASTNIEVLDAQRASRDADTAAVVAEDQLRQARLALLVALGQFPG
jgi:outer membrane protein